MIIRMSRARLAILAVIKRRFFAVVAVVAVVYLVAHLTKGPPELNFNFKHLLQYKDSLVTVPLPKASYETLRRDLWRRIQDLKDAGYWKENPSIEICGQEKNFIEAYACHDLSCNSTAVRTPELGLQDVLSSMVEVDEELMGLLLAAFGARRTGKHVLFITGASSNHFYESQALVKSLHELVFPQLNNYTFVYYDLGLTGHQRQQLERHCRCEVRDYPFRYLPWRLQDLQCYTWKTFIVHANLPTADVVIWHDASVRYNSTLIHDLLHEVHVKGVVLAEGEQPYSMADHIHQSMFRYFREDACAFAQVAEKQPGFLVVKNERFVEQVLIRPWSACAMSPQCMCPRLPASLIICNTKVRQYNKCHRFDQAAMNVLLSKLFWGHQVSFTPSKQYIDIRKEEGTPYFDDLDQRG